MTLRRRVHRLEQLRERQLAVLREEICERMQAVFTRSDDDALWRQQKVLDILEQVNEHRLAELGISERIRQYDAYFRGEGPRPPERPFPPWFDPAALAPYALLTPAARTMSDPPPS